MKKFLLILLISCCALVGCHHPDANDSNGKPISLSDYRGKWVVINYWATWCKPCLAELPDLNSLAVNSADQVVVLGVNYDQLPNEDINKFAAKLAVTFPMLQAFPMEKFGVKDISVLPMTFIINPEGKLAKVLEGPQTQASLKAAMISMNGESE